METPAPAPRWHLPVLLGGALVIRLVAWSRALMMMNDGPDFLWQALRLLEGDVRAAIDHPYHPGYGAAVALVSWITRLDVETAGIAVSIASGLVLVLAVWAAARWIFPSEPRAAYIAGAVVAIFPRTVVNTSDIQSDSLFLALVGLALWMVTAAIARGGCRRRMLVAGVVTGLAYLTRPEGLFLGAVAGVWLLAPRSPTPLARRALALAVFAAGTLIGVLPYVVAIHDLTGSWGLSMKPSLRAAGLTTRQATPKPPADSPLGAPIVATAPADAAPGSPRDEAPGGGAPHGDPGGRDGGDAGAREDEPSALDSTRESVRELLRTLRLELLLLSVPGLVALRRQDPFAVVALLALLAVYTALIAVHHHRNGYISNRHMMIPVVMLAPLSGAGWLTLWHARPPWWRNTLRVLLVLSLLTMTLTGIRPRREYNGNRLEALAWIGSHSAPEQRFGTHRRRDGWYAGRPVVLVELPYDPHDLARKVERHDVSYVLMDLEDVADEMPELLAPGATAGLTEVRRFEADGLGETVVVFAPSGA